MTPKFLTAYSYPFNVSFGVDPFPIFGMSEAIDISKLDPYLFTNTRVTYMVLECGPMPNLMVALPNTGGAVCSTPQSLADAHD